MTTAAAWLSEALAHHKAGRLAEAEKLYGNILRVDPRNADVLQFLGLILLSRGDVGGAIGRIRQALAINPRAGVYHFNLGLALSQSGDLSAAVESYRRAVKLAPELAEAHNNLGNCLRLSGDAAGAAESFRRAAAVRPNYAEAHINLSAALFDLGRVDDAERAARRALALAPTLPEIHIQLGNVQQRRGHLDEAIAWYRKALELKPSYPLALNNLGVALQEEGKLEDAIDVYRQALANGPDADASNNLGLALEVFGEFAEATALFRRAAEIRSDFSTAFRHLLTMMLYDPDRDTSSRWGLAEEFESRYAGDWRARASAARFGNARDEKRRLRIGYVSSDMYEHPVGRNLEPVLRHRDRVGFEVVCYAEVMRPDTMTARLQGLVDAWRPTVGLTDEQVAAQGRSDGIDILVVLASRFDRNRPLVASYYGAPVQVSFHDPGTSGLRSMEYLIADPVLVPRGGLERFSERVVRVPSFYVHDPLTEAPAVGPVPAASCGYVTFGSFNNPAKVNDAVLGVWGEVLRRVPNSRLKLKCKNWFAMPRLQTRFLDRLGVDKERIEFDTAERRIEEHLGLYNDIDIALDPFPFTGSTTTFEALWMGVPVVTLLGEAMAGRWSASMLHGLKLDELVARTRDEYVALAAGLAGDLGRLAGLRSGLRARVASSSLCDGRGRARQVERLYRALWRRWCRRS